MASINYKLIEDSLMKKYPELLVLALTDSDKREELKEIILADYTQLVNNDKSLAEEITREIVGTGIIEKILTDYEDVTDIEYDGSRLSISGVTHFEFLDNEDINEEYVQRLIQKFAAATRNEFSTKRPILDCVFGNIRLNAVHHANTTGGTTFSMRIVRPKLVLNKTNFNKFAPDFILDFLKVSKELYSNTIIGGPTGTGKTEVQKLGISFLKGSKEKIITIQDVNELFAKLLNPDKLIYEWLITNGISLNVLLEAVLRNNPKWVIVSETRDEAAYGLYQVLISDHHVITSVHTAGSLLIPKRLAQLAKFAPQAVNMPIEMLENDFERLLDFGWYIKKETMNEKDYRYLSEIASFDPGDSRLIFNQFLDNNNILHWHTYELPNSFKEKLKRKGIQLDFPENDSGTIDLNDYSLDDSEKGLLVG
jgi:pilus assembly protein CpaF